MCPRTWLVVQLGGFRVFDIFDESGGMERFANQRFERTEPSRKVAPDLYLIVANCFCLSHGLGSGFLSSAVLVNKIAYLYLYVSFRTPNETCCANLQLHVIDRLPKETEKIGGGVLRET